MVLEAIVVAKVGTNELSLESETELPVVELNGSSDDSTGALVGLSVTIVELAAE